MAIVELNTFDIATATPLNFATGGFWASLPRLSAGSASVKLLMISDTLKPSDIVDGFNDVALSEQGMPPSVRAYRVQYEDYLERVARDVRYMRIYLAMDTYMDDEGLIQLLSTYGISGKVVEDEIPLPFTRGKDAWHSVECEDGMRYAMLRSKARQSGQIYPRSLHRLFSMEFPVWAAMTIHTYSSQESDGILRRKGVAAKYSRGDAEQAQEARDVLGTVDSIRHEMNRYGAALHVTRFHVVVGGESAGDLKTKINVVSGATPFLMEPAPVSNIPAVFNARASISTDGAVITTPGVSVLAGSALSYKRRTATDGVLFGIDQNQSLVILNQFDSRNPSYNANVLGQTGSGKTFGILVMMMRHLLLGCRLIIVDPQGNIDLSFLGDDYYHVSRLGTSTAAINILDIVRDEMADQVSSIKNTMSMLKVLPPNFPLGESILDEALMDIYGPIWGKPGAEQMVPTLDHLQKRIDRIAQKANMQSVRDAAALLSFMMTPYTEGSLKQLFGLPTTVDFSLRRPINVYDVSRLPDPTMGGHLRTALLAILVADINASIRRLRRTGDTTPIIFFVDEMGILMRDAVVAAYVSNEYKTARSRRVAMIVADQDLHSMLGPQDEHGLHHGIPILANSAFSFIFRQKGSEKPAIREHFPDIPHELVERLPQMRQGNCIAMLPDDLLTVNVLPSPLDKVILSSKLEDKAKAKEITRQLMREAMT